MNDSPTTARDTWMSADCRVEQGSCLTHGGAWPHAVRTGEGLPRLLDPLSAAGWDALATRHRLAVLAREHYWLVLGEPERAASVPSARSLTAWLSTVGLLRGTPAQDVMARQHVLRERTADRDRGHADDDLPGGVGDPAPAGGPGPDRGEPRRLNAYEMAALAPMLTQAARSRADLRSAYVDPQYVVLGSWWWDVLTDYGLTRGGTLYGLPILHDAEGPLRKVEVVGSRAAY